MTKRLGIIAVVLLIPVFILSGCTDTTEVEFPNPDGFINDYTGTFGADSLASMERIAAGLKEKTGAEIAVAVVDTVSPLDAKTYAVELFEEWKIGERDKDNGLLILLALNERRIEVEVGYGLEGVLPDSKVGRLLDEMVVPYLREDRFSEGMLAGVQAFADVIAREYGAELNLDGALPGSPSHSPESSSFITIPLLLVAALALLLFALIATFVRRALSPKCPNCRTRLTVREIVVTPATAFQAGEGVRMFSCPRCGYNAESPFRIAPGGRGGFFGPFWGGRGGRGGGFGGGGFGGFGGGSSGGGGAGRGF